MKYFISFVNHFHIHKFISLVPWGDNGHQRVSDLCVHHPVKQDLLSQKFATSYILLTNDEYIASLNPLMELKHRAAVRMDFKIDYMQQSAWDANNRSARQFPPLLWKYVHINQPCVPTLRQMNPVRTILADFIRVSGILTSTSYVPMPKVNTLKYNIHVNSFKHSKKKKCDAMDLLSIFKKSGMGSTTKFTVFNFGPYQSITKLLHKKLKLNTPRPPSRRGVRQKSKRKQR